MSSTNDHSGPSRHRQSGEDELSVYLGVLWRRWPVIVVGTALAGIIGLAVAWSLPTLYSASVTVLVESPDRTGADAALASLGALLRRSEVTSDVANTLQPAVVDSDALAETVSVAPGTKPNTANVTLELDDPELASRALDLMVIRALALYDELETESAAALQKSLEGRIRQSAERLSVLEKKVAELWQKVDIGRTELGKGAAKNAWVYTSQLELLRLGGKLDAAHKTHLELETRYEQAGNAETWARFTTLSRAVAARVPIRASLGFTLMAACLAGLILATVAAFAIDYVSNDEVRARVRA